MARIAEENPKKVVISGPNGVTVASLRKKFGATRFEVCKLYWFCDMSQDEIAKQVGISQPAVVRHLSKAIKQYPALARMKGGRHRTWRESDISGFLATYRMN